MGHSNVLLYLLADLAVIVLLARLAGMGARRIGQPAVIGEVAAGILLGPTVLGRFDASLPGELFPREVPLEQLAQLGLVFFMFLVGLELDPALVRSQGWRAAQISLSGIVLPLGLGIALGLGMYETNLGGAFLGDNERPGRLAFAVFLGAAMCITAFPILARILVETGLYRTSVGAATLCAGAVDDVVAWILLAGVVSVVEGGSIGEAFVALGLTAVFATFMLMVARPLLAAFARRSSRSGQLSLEGVAVIVAGLLASAYVTELIGIHAIFGAFLFGAIMPKRTHLTKELTDRIEDFTVVVLLPLFFAVAGLRTNLFSLDSPALLGWLGLILVAAVGGKFLGCGLAARLTGSSWRDSVVVGALMNARGLTELVILSIGLNLGILSDRTFAMMVVMALVTTVMAAPIVNRLMPRARRAAEIAAAEERPEALVASRVLVSVEDLDRARPLIDFGLGLTGNERPAELILVRLIEPPRGAEFRSGLAEESLALASSLEHLRELAAEVASAGLAVRTLTFLSSQQARDLAVLAEDEHCTAVVIAGDRAEALIPPAGRFDLLQVDLPARTTQREGVVAIVQGDAGDEAVARTAEVLSASGQDVSVLGLAAPGRTDEVSRAAAHAVDRLARGDGTVAPAPLVAADDLASAIAAAGHGLALVSESSQALAIPPGTTIVRIRGRASEEAQPAIEGLPGDWPFLPPGGVPRGVALAALPAGPHLQRLDGWGRPVAAAEAGATALSIGRLPSNRLALVEDQLVSRNHALIEERSGEYHLRDMGSRNGTRVWRDGEWQLVADTALQDGDLVVIGANVFRWAIPEAA